MTNFTVASAIGTALGPRTGSCLPLTFNELCSPVERLRVICSFAILLGGFKVSRIINGAPVAIPPNAPSQSVVGSPSLRYHGELYSLPNASAVFVPIPNSTALAPGMAIKA